MRGCASHNDRYFIRGADTQAGRGTQLDHHRGLAYVAFVAALRIKCVELGLVMGVQRDPARV